MPFPVQAPSTQVVAQGQVFPQLPQLYPSVFMLSVEMHELLQKADPGPQTQAPDWHVAPSGQRAEPVKVESRPQVSVLLRIS
jgi:hypothetical protein